MAELGVNQRLQPSLLDRLSDNEPHRTKESRVRATMSAEGLRSSVMRDLTWLLNTSGLSQTEDLSEVPEVAKSVLNYGLPDLAGSTVSGVDNIAIERALRETILNFEPRIEPNTLSVRVLVDEHKMNHNALIFEITGDLLSKPLPLRLFLKTEVDLETGEVSVSDYD